MYLLSYLEGFVGLTIVTTTGVNTAL